MPLAFVAISPAASVVQPAQWQQCRVWRLSHTPVLGKQLPQGRGREMQPSPCQIVPVNKRNGQEELTTAETMIMETPRMNTSTERSTVGNLVDNDDWGFNGVWRVFYLSPGQEEHAAVPQQKDLQNSKEYTRSILSHQLNYQQSEHELWKICLTMGRKFPEITAHSAEIFNLKFFKRYLQKERRSQKRVLVWLCICYNRHKLKLKKYKVHRAPSSLDIPLPVRF